MVQLEQSLVPELRHSIQSLFFSIAPAAASDVSQFFATFAPILGPLVSALVPQLDACCQHAPVSLRNVAVTALAQIIACNVQRDTPPPDYLMPVVWNVFLLLESPAFSVSTEGSQSTLSHTLARQQIVSGSRNAILQVCS